METIKLGKTEMSVTRLGFGGIPIQRLSEDRAVEVVRKCIDLGITFLDTANGYTTSEERIGKAIKGQREKLVIATKASGANEPKEIEERLQTSLERMNTDYVDVYYGVHGLRSAGQLTSKVKAWA